MKSDPDRLQLGEQKIGEILGQTGDQVRQNVGDVAPGLATFVLEVIYGGIYQSELLDSKTRQIVTVAALAALGNARPQLCTHISGALNCGCTRSEIIEIMMQIAAFAGVPAALNGVDAARSVFERLDKEG
jgi:4-carboxymuconolactone decarboxylase